MISYKHKRREKSMRIDITRSIKNRKNLKQPKQFLERNRDRRLILPDFKTVYSHSYQNTNFTNLNSRNKFFQLCSINFDSFQDNSTRKCSSFQQMSSITLPLKEIDKPAKNKITEYIGIPSGLG